MIGIPTVKRPKGYYITSTLQSLFENMNYNESLRCLVVVFIGDTDYNLVNKTITHFQSLFGQQLDEGLLDVVVPDPTFYPNASTFRSGV